jgi:hypothetical protein
MATLKVQVEELVGSVTDTIALDEYLTATAKEVLSVIPKSVLSIYTTSEAMTSNPKTLGDKLPVIVTRAGRLVKEVSSGLSQEVEDTGSLHVASTRDPVFYVKNKQMTIIPAPASSPNDAVIEYIAMPVGDNTQTAIAGFPSIASYAVILGTAVKFLTKKMNDFIHIEEDVELAQTTKLQIDTLNQLYQADLQRIAQLK